MIHYRWEIGKIWCIYPNGAHPKGLGAGTTAGICAQNYKYGSTNYVWDCLVELYQILQSSNLFNPYSIDYLFSQFMKPTNTVFIIIILHFIFGINLTFGQFRKIKQDTSYIKSYYHKLIITNANISRNYDIALVHPLNEQSQVYYTSSLPANYGIGLDYKWLALEYTVKLSVLENPTWQRSFRTGITGKRIWAKAFWQEFRGLGREINTDKLSTEAPETVFRADIYSRMGYMNVMYAFNGRTYSHLASLYQVDKQRKSAGSWAVGLSFMRNYTKGDSAIVKYDYGKPSNQDDILKVGAMSFFVQGGYAHTFVFGKQQFFVNLSLFPAFGFQRTSVKYLDKQVEKQESRLGFQNEVQISFGYNTDIFFTGFRVENFYFLDGVDTQAYHGYGLTQARVFIGVRL